MIAKPFYILIVAISLMGGSAAAQTKPIPGSTARPGLLTIHADTETGVEYIVSTGDINAAATVTLRACVTDNGTLGTVARFNGTRTCVPNR